MDNISRIHVFVYLIKRFLILFCFIRSEISGHSICASQTLLDLTVSVENYYQNVSLNMLIMEIDSMIIYLTTLIIYYKF